MTHLEEKYLTGEFSPFHATTQHQSNDENLAPTSEQPPLKKTCRRNKGNELMNITA